MRKNKFLTFLFSVIPGCGHMYLGYMKRGVEYMAMFAASVYFAIVFISAGYSMQFLGSIFLLLLPIIWLYQMFAAMHTITQQRRLRVEFPEDDGFFVPGISNVANLNALNVFKKPKVAKWIAAILIVVGAYALFANVTNGVYDIIITNSIGDYWRQQYWTVYNAVRNLVPAVIISTVLIFAGIKLLAASKNKSNNEDNR